MAEPKAVVRNAADREQVKRGKETEQSAAEQKARRLLVVGSTYEGRQFLWELIADCRVFESIMQTNATIYFNAGQQDLGHKWMMFIQDTSPELWMQCQKEHFNRQRNIPEPISEDEHE